MSIDVVIVVAVVIKYYSWITSVLLFSLGAKHDGQGNECDSDNQFIMATGPTTLGGSNFNNSYRFSHCSVESFRQYLNRLNGQVVSQRNR